MAEESSAESNPKRVGRFEDVQAAHFSKLERREADSRSPRMKKQYKSQPPKTQRWGAVCARPNLSVRDTIET
jgi:hypothetical protein